MTKDESKQLISKDVQAYHDAGLSVEDYVYDTLRVNNTYAWEQGYNFCAIIMGTALALLGVGAYFWDKHKYHKKISQMEDRINYRIEQTTSNVMTAEDLDAQINVDVNVDV